MELKVFQTVSVLLCPLFPKYTFTWQTMFLLSLENMAAIVVTLGEVSGPLVLSDLLLRSYSLPGNRCYLERRKHGWTHWFPNTRPWQSCHWSMAKWENKDLEALGVGMQLPAAKWGPNHSSYSWSVFSNHQPLPESVLYPEMITSRHFGC